MGINFDAIMSNGKGATNIAKIKVTLLGKTDELNKSYIELGKAFYEFLKNKCSNKEDDAMCTYGESVEVCLEKIKGLEKEISDLESQIINEKNSFKPMAAKNQFVHNMENHNVFSENNTENYTEGTAPPMFSGNQVVQCPNCGKVQSSDNAFCENCGYKMSEY